MSKLNVRLVYMTFPSKKEAKRTGEALLKERLAACVNVFSDMRSVYWWKGEIESSKEVVMIAKTSVRKYPALKKRVLELHSYECPCILMINIEDGHKGYLDWLNDSLNDPPLRKLKRK